MEIQTRNIQKRTDLGLVGYVSNLEQEPLDEPCKSESDKGLLRKAVDCYFEPKSFEKSGRLYRGLGIKFFKKILPTGGDYVNRLLKYKIEAWSLKKVIETSKNQMEGLRFYHLATKLYETGHLMGGTFLTYEFFQDISRGEYESAIKTGLVNLLVNGYPIMLQRYNRSRINKVIEKMEVRGK